MPHRDASRRGSLAYIPRKRAARIYPRTKEWAHSAEAKPLGFAGWKAGMTHIQFQDANSKSPTYGRMVSRAVTIIDAPSLFVAALRFYKKGGAGRMAIGEKWTKNFPKGLDIKRKVLPGKVDSNNISGADDVRLVVATQPEEGGIDKKKPEVFELALGGKFDDKLKYGESILGKAVDAKDIFKVGEMVDVSSVTKGHGYTGVVKRYGVRVQTRKDKQMHRHVGSIGSTVPRKVDWRVPQAGQFGFFTRTEFGKRIISVNDDKVIAPKGGFMRYGPVKSYLLIEGSVPGPKKRLIRIRKSVRSSKIVPLDIKYTSIESKQGR